MAALGLLFSSTWSKVWPYLLIAGAIIAVLLGFYEKGKTAGTAAIQAKDNAALIKAQKRTINEQNAATMARDSVRELPPSQVLDRDKFSRD